MNQNLLDQLADVEVPPPPPSLPRDVHDRLNHWLLAAQVADLVFRGFFYGTLYFGQAVAGMIGFTLTGKYQTRRDNDKKSS